MNNITRRNFIKSTAAASASALLANHASAQKKPNVVWICVEDMSAHMSCYGETTIQTPNIDQLAQDGTRFTNAVVTCPVCSPSRCAMITGMYQTTIGAHNHRSSRHDVKIKLPSHMRLIPEYFKEAGYYVSNGDMLSLNPGKPTKKGKTDYNFEFDRDVYHGFDWRGRQPGQPFFAQFQLRGGKNRGAKVNNPVDPADVKLPPYYADHPVLREDWAKYLNSVLHVDEEVKGIIQALKDEGELGNTYIFFWTDHGISHVRGKQFVYEEGMHIPLIIRGPGIESNLVKDDLVEHIDIPYTSLQLCGIPVPEHLQGRPLVNTTQSPRGYVVSARDRCDETVERIRAVRTKRFKYIRNYYHERPHAQANRYKDGKAIMQTMRKLYEEGKLNEAQAKPFLPTRPEIELYDLKNDPYELHNLAESPDHQTTLLSLQKTLRKWEETTLDMGRFPEPYLAEIHNNYDSFYAIMRDEKQQQLAIDIQSLWGKGNYGNFYLESLQNHLNDERELIRYQTLMEFAKMGKEAAQEEERILRALKDDSELVQLAAAWAAEGIGKHEPSRDKFVSLLKHSNNESTRHYAAMGLENMGEKAGPVLDVIQHAGKNDNYEYVKRVCTRTASKLR